MKLSLLFAVMMLAACGEKAFPGKPDLPKSVSPGWAMKSYEGASVPDGLPAGVQPQCWKAEYTGAQNGTAEVWVCGYRESGSAFNAMQRARASANTVKFQKDRFIVLVRWNGSSRTDLVALMRVLENTLK